MKHKTNAFVRGSSATVDKLNWSLERIEMKKKKGKKITDKFMAVVN